MVVELCHFFGIVFLQVVPYVIRSVERKVERRIFRIDRITIFVPGEIFVQSF